MKQCTRCRWHLNEEGINCTSFDGNPDADVVFIGEAYGSSEAREGRPFVGKAGKVLDKLLEMANLSREDVAIINSLRCFQKGNPTPTKVEMDACFIHTYKDIRSINPKLVIALGNCAMYQVSGNTGIESHRGNLFWSDKIKCNVFCTYHPASVLYNKKRWDDLVEDFSKIPSLLHGEKPVIKHYDYIYINKEELVESAIDELSQHEILMLDTESTGLSPYKDELHIIQLGGFEQDKVFIFDKALVDKEKFKSLLDKKIGGQTFEFDVKMTSVQCDMFFDNWYHDTCLAEYVLTGMKENDLTSLTAKYASESIGYDKDVYDLGGAHKLIGKDEKKLRQYASDDVGVLSPITRRQRKRLEEEGQLWLFDNIVMPANKVLTKMSLRGVMYDLEHLWKTDEFYRKRAERAYLRAMSLEGVEACEKHFGRQFNPRSSLMVRWLMIDYYKLPVLQVTDKDNPSVGMEEMERYAEKYKNEYCMVMGDYRSYNTLRENFLGGVVPHLIDGIAHSKFSLHSTTTGRPNSKLPNLLNTPRIKEIKRCIVARPGHKFVYSDQSQLEVRIAAFVYSEPRLIEIVNDFSKDMHCRITAQAFNVSYDDVYNGYKNGDGYWTELRVSGKTVQFGVIYQEGASKLSYQLKISKEKGQQFIDNYYSNFPDLKENIEETKKEVIKNGYLTNYFGFKRHWEFHSEEDHNTLREAVNFKVQSLAWNLLELCMIQVDKELQKRKLKSQLVLQVYDSLVSECPDEEVDEVAHITKEIMDNVNKPFEGVNIVKLKADIQVGPNLADLEDYKI